MQQIEESKKVGKFHNEIVSKKRIQFQKKLSIGQQKLLYYLIIKEKNGESLQGVKWSHLQEVLGLEKNYTNAEKKVFIDEMTSIKIFLELDDESIESRVIFPNFGIHYKKINYTINESVKELFESPAIKYYLMNFDFFKHFKRNYSLLIYQLINKELGANEKVKRTFTYDIDELKEYLSMENSNYSDKDFKQRVLDPSLEEINEYTDIKIAGAYNKKTKKYQLSSKVRGKNEFIIGGISRKITTQEYVQEQFDNAIIAKEDGKTKINKESKISNNACEIEKSNEVHKDLYGEFKHVQLSKEQYKQALSLFDGVGELNIAITLLDEYFEQMPEMVNKFNNHYISLKRFSKNIIDAQNAKVKQNGNYNYNNATKETYAEPSYEKFTEDDAPKFSLVEIKALLDDPFGSSVEDVNEAVGEIESIVTSSYLENEGENLSNEESTNSVPSGLFSAVVDLYFWFFEGVVSKEQASSRLKEIESKYNYILNKDEKVKLYQEAKDTWEMKLPF